MGKIHTLTLLSLVPSLNRGEVHVWCLSLNLQEREESNYFSLLSPDEKARADNFYSNQARKDFIAGRGLLRILLGQYLAIEPAGIQFKYDNGRPVLDHLITFSVSHSEGLGVYIFGQGCRMGIDVERIKPLSDLEALARRYFTEKESSQIHSLSGRLQQEIFYKIWTCKEAYLKALGVGLFCPLDQIEISLESTVSGETDRWKLGIFTPVIDYQAAVIIEDPNRQITFPQFKRCSHLNFESVGYQLHEAYQ